MYKFDNLKQIYIYTDLYGNVYESNEVAIIYDSFCNNLIKHGSLSNIREYNKRLNSLDGIKEVISDYRTFVFCVENCMMLNELNKLIEISATDRPKRLHNLFKDNLFLSQSLN